MQKVIYELKGEEKENWAETVRNKRGDLIKSPDQYVNNFFDENDVTLDDISSNISEFIRKIREDGWENYLIDEVNFHKEVLLSLFEKEEIPSEIFNELIDEKFERNIGDLKFDEINKNIMSLFGEFTGRIMPYIYYLSLSTTNSRRARAGKTFESIIDKIIKLYNYPYDDQSSLGNDFFNENNIGKMVDGIIPGEEYFYKNRVNCQILTMKTTLRERWQEVVEELSRTSIPHIYLLTLDQGMNEDLLDILNRHNITVVNYNEVKNKFPHKSNIISFNKFFNEEIPHVLDYWDLT